MVRFSVFQLLFLVLLGNISCNKILKDDDFQLIKRPFVGTSLRLDGYYYYKKDGVYSGMCCFYRNGIFLDLGGAANDYDLSTIEKDIINGSYYNYLKEKKYFWGIYNIDSNAIKFEKYYPPGNPFKAFVSNGIILNDSSFLINSSNRSNENKLKPRNELYIFKKFSPKPDSTNPFF